MLTFPVDQSCFCFLSRTRLDELFGQIEREFEHLYAENLARKCSNVGSNPKVDTAHCVLVSFVQVVYEILVCL